MAERQYVAVKFNPWDHRSYTYANDGPPVAEGDKVLVTTAKGQATVDVVAVHYDKLSFATKPIDGIAPPPVSDAAMFPDGAAEQ